MVKTKSAKDDKSASSKDDGVISLTLDGPLPQIEGRLPQKDKLPVGSEFASKITEAFSLAVNCAVKEHRAAGRPVYGLDENGKITKS